MFKLKKIFNSGVNVPEPEIVPVQPPLSGKPGCAFVLSEGKLIRGDGLTMPSYINIAPIKSSDTSAICYRITPDMLFEVEIMGEDISSVENGMKLPIYLEKNAFCKVGDIPEDGLATVYDTNGATKDNDTVYVVFK